jgi:hypothetical protein
MGISIPTAPYASKLTMKGTSAIVAIGVVRGGSVATTALVDAAAYLSSEVAERLDGRREDRRGNKIQSERNQLAPNMSALYLGT